MRYLRAIGILVIISQSCSLYELPSYIKPCKRNDPELATCWKQQLENLRPHLINGIGELAVKLLDPWDSPTKVPITQPTFTALFGGGTYTGVRDYKVLNNSIDLQNNVLALQIAFDRLVYHGNLQMKGSLLGYTIDGTGKANGNYENLKLAIKLSGERATKKGKEYIRFNNADIEVEIEKYSVEVVGVLDNPDIEKVFNQILGQQIEAFLPLLKLIVAKSIGNDIAQSIQLVYERYPLNVLHP